MGLNMESKYYTPTIEEFHVGFEFDLNDTVRDGSGRKEWSYEIKFSIAIANYVKLILEKSPEDVRVKYLDKEDIESLGWVLQTEELKTGKYPSHWCVFKKDNNELYIQLANVNNSYPNKLTIRGNGNSNIGNIRLLIKNKSELKKLMKQLGIYE